ncbi:MAG: DUF3048 domain-containing protein [Patescibacteria group bacterium]
MTKRDKIIISALSLMILGFSLFALFYFLRGANSFSVTPVKSERSGILSNQESGKASPFSGVNCQNYNGRALSVVLAQYPETMPLSGVSQADIVIEGPVANPGGVNRLVAIYQCQSPAEVGSIRSVRPYMVDLALGFDTVFSSWGGCKAAIERIKSIGLDWLDARINLGGAFFRKRNTLAPHNGFAWPEKLKTAASSLKMRMTNQFEGYKFLRKEEIILSEEEQSIKINSTYPAEYVYDPKTGGYLRYWNGRPMIDRNTAEQVLVKNVILMKTAIGVLSRGVVDVKITGKGETIIYQGGREVKGTWQKDNPRAKLYFFDEKGEELKFIPGSIWIEVVKK